MLSDLHNLMLKTFKHRILINGIAYYFNDDDFKDNIYYSIGVAKDGTIRLIKHTYNYQKAYKTGKYDAFAKLLKGRYSL